MDSIDSRHTDGPRNISPDVRAILDQEGRVSRGVSRKKNKSKRKKETM